MATPGNIDKTVYWSYRAAYSFISKAKWRGRANGPMTLKGMVMRIKYVKYYIGGVVFGFLPLLPLLLISFKIDRTGNSINATTPLVGVVIIAACVSFIVMMKETRWLGFGMLTALFLLTLFVILIGSIVAK